MNNNNYFFTHLQNNYNESSFAEVIESSLDKFVAQCWQWDNFPKFGSLVQVKNKNITILGCIANIQTESTDPLRYPFPYKKTEEELHKEQPQIFEFLKTTFNVKVLGYIENQTEKHYLLPLYPCKIHSFVNQCSSKFTNHFFSVPDFLYPLFSGGSPLANQDNLLLAILKQLAKDNILTNKIIQNFCKTLSLLEESNYRKIKLLLKQIETLL